MSKVVKGIGRAIGSVVKGVAKAVKSVVKSPVGKILLAAATVYFGGAALMGASQGFSAGSGFLGTITSSLEGAMTGIGNAWTSLGTAASQAMSGNFANAGTALSGGLEGSAVTVGADGALTTTPMSMGAPAGLPAAKPVATTPPPTAPAVQTVAEKAAENAATKPGLISQAWDKLGPYGKMAAVQTGGNIIQGIGQQKALEEQRQYELKQAQAARDRANTNIGTRLWGSPSDYVDDPMLGYRAMADRYANIANNAGIIQSNMPVVYPPKVA